MNHHHRYACRGRRGVSQGPSSMLTQDLAKWTNNISLSFVLLRTVNVSLFLSRRIAPGVTENNFPSLHAHWYGIHELHELLTFSVAAAVQSSELLFLLTAVVLLPSIHSGIGIKFRKMRLSLNFVPLALVILLPFYSVWCGWGLVKVLFTRNVD